MIREVVLTRINIVLAALLVAVTAYALLFVPAEVIIPVHWGVDGRPDGFAGRTWAFLMLPVLVVVIMGVFSTIVRLAPPEQVQAGKSGLSVAISAILVLFLTIQVGMLLIGMGFAAVNMMQLIALGLALLLIVTGNVMPKTQPNHLAGLRLPWTLRDRDNWRATHRLVGALMMASGVLLAVLALLPVHPVVLFVGLLAAIFVPLIIGGIYSYRMSKRA